MFDAVLALIVDILRAPFYTWNGRRACDDLLAPHRLVPEIEHLPTPPRPAALYLFSQMGP